MGRVIEFIMDMALKTKLLFCMAAKKRDRTEILSKPRISGRRRKFKMKTVPYKEMLLKKLAEYPDAARYYLNEAIEGGDLKVFLIALRDVAEAFGGMGKVAKKAKLNRVSLY